MDICLTPSVYLNRTYEKVEFQAPMKEAIDRFIEGYFKQPCKVVLYPMKGGHSDAKNYFLEVDGIPYVLRVENPNVSLKHNKRELFAFLEASKVRIAPKVYAISDDFNYALIEYINVPTLTFAQAKEHLPQAAGMFATLHSLPQNPYPRKRLKEQYLKIYEELKQNKITFMELEEAIRELQTLDAAILSYKVPSTTIHGDLHPRNVFFTDTFLAVDWEGVSYDDPFYDLTFFAALNDYTLEEETRLLEFYLKRFPTPDENKRYALCRKTNLIFLGLTCLFQSHFSSIEEKAVLEMNSNLADWSYFITNWAEKGEHPAQFFFDWGRQSIKKALLIN